MKIYQDEEEFRPVNIRIETQDELDIFIAIVSAVASGSVNYAPQVSAEAKKLSAQLSKASS